MKIINFLLILPLFLNSFLSSELFSQSDWVMRSTGCNLNSVYFYDDMIGYVAGDSGTILVTVDGGSNWQCIISGTSQSLKSIFFINSLTGWIAGSGGVILKTTDGGVKWISLSTGTSLSLSSVYFPTIDTGYSVGPSVTLKTTDGGTSWVTLVAFNGAGVYFSSGLKGLVADNVTYLAKTIDGGSSWSINTAPGNPVNQYAISFVNANTGWTTGAGNRAFKTTNGGNNWITQTNSASGSAKFYGIDFNDDLNGYIAGYSGFFSGDSGIIYSTSNGGTNWTSLPTGIKITFRDVEFIDAMTGWAVGDGGVIINTTNGGISWNKQLTQYSSPFTQNLSLFDIQFQNEMTGYTCGMDGYINKTTNGGNTWNTITTASFNYLYSIYFPQDNDTGWACGRLGTIEKTMNGGINWVTEYTGTSQHLNFIVMDKFSDVRIRNGFCVGDNGTILATDTAGLLWSPQFSGTTNNLNSIYVFNDSEAIIAGNAGTILFTSNGGLTSWISKTSGTSADLKSVYFIDRSTGYVCGNGGTIRMTTDGGSNWSAQSSGSTSQLNSIDFEETVTENGYAVGENGTILSTTNGGITWNKESSGGSVTLYSVFAKEIPSASGFLYTAIKTVGKYAKYALKKPVTALPVELTSFDFSVTENNVTLNWQTSGEMNNSGFDVERNSSDNIVWRKIGFVQGNGTAGGNINYTFMDGNINSGNYNYRLKQTDYNGNYEYFNLNSEVVIGQPDNFQLKQNYPNPFNPNTNIEFHISNLGYVSLKVYDMSGKEVRTLVNEIKEAGYYSVIFDGSDLSSGIYFYKMQINGKENSRKMLLLK